MKRDSSTRKQTEVGSRLLIVYTIALSCLLGFPFWYKYVNSKTSIPFTDRILHHENVLNDLTIYIPVYLKFSDFNFPDLMKASQAQMDFELAKINEKSITNYNIELKDGNNLSEEEEAEIISSAYLIEAVLGPTDAVAVDDWDKKTILVYTLDSVYSNDLPFFVTQAVIYHIFENEFKLMERDCIVGKKSSRNLAIDYSANVNINFILINGVTGGLASWEIEDALNKFFVSFTFLTQKFVNFTIFTEVFQHFDDNLIQFDDINNLITDLKNHGSDFRNDNADPTLNFITYVSDSESTTNSVLLPKWGGINFLSLSQLPESANGLINVTTDNLEMSIESSVQHIMKLLDLPNNPRTPVLKIEIAKRYQSIYLIYKTFNHLKSLVKLVSKSSNIIVPEEISKLVSDCIRRIDDSINEVNEQNWDLSLRYAWEAFEQAEKAYFHKQIFPKSFWPNTTLMVYFPLIVPVSIIVIGWCIKLTRIWIRTKNSNGEKNA